MSIYFNIYIFG